MLTCAVHELLLALHFSPCFLLPVNMTLPRSSAIIASISPETSCTKMSSCMVRVAPARAPNAITIERTFCQLNNSVQTVLGGRVSILTYSWSIASTCNVATYYVCLQEDRKLTRQLASAYFFRFKKPFFCGQGLPLQTQIRRRDVVWY